MSAGELFGQQLVLICNLITPNCFIIGDFNLDARMEHRNDYTNKKYLDDLITLTLENNFDQVVNFDTWSRTINCTKKAPYLIMFTQITMPCLTM